MTIPFVCVLIALLLIVLSRVPVSMAMGQQDRRRGTKLSQQLREVSDDVIDARRHVVRHLDAAVHNQQLASDDISRQVAAKLTTAPHRNYAHCGAP